MRSFTSFFRKELLDCLRSGKFIIFGSVFIGLGILSPVLTAITPWLMEILQADLEGSGLSLGTITVNAIVSWAESFSNISMGLIAFVFVLSNSFTKEYSHGTLIPLVTKGLSRTKVTLAKTAMMLLLWTVSYLICFGVTFAINEIIWDNSQAMNLAGVTFNWWLFGALTVALMVLFSAVFRGYAGVLLGTGGSLLAFYLLSLIPRLAKFMPTSLMNTTSLLYGIESMQDYLYAILISCAIIIGCIISGVFIMRKKEL